MKSHKLSLIAVTALLFVGCSNTPDDAVSNMYDALKEGNSVKLANSAEETMSISIISQSLKNCSIEKTEETNDFKRVNKCLKEEYENLEYKDLKIEKVSKESVLATVKVINNEVENEVILRVKKINGKWMVLGRKKQ